MLRPLVPAVTLCLSLSASAEPRLVYPGLEPGAEDAEHGVSCGWPNRGSLHDSVELAIDGPGYVIPEPWASRDRRHGTPELVELLQRAAARVKERYPAAILGVGDLSREGGGAVTGHLSHQSGRDVDLIYYAVDLDGEPMEPDAHMAWYKYSGVASYARAPQWDRDIQPRKFSVERNWALVKALVTDPHTEVIRIFVSWRVRRWLLQHAEDQGEPEELQQRAREILLQPSNAGGHNDHMHVRIGCSDRDVELGRCRHQSTSSPRGGGRWRGGGRCPKL